MEFLEQSLEKCFGRIIGGIHERVFGRNSRGISGRIKNKMLTDFMEELVELLMKNMKQISEIKL